jgi:hypothetical protein
MVPSLHRQADDLPPIPPPAMEHLENRLSIELPLNAIGSIKRCANKLGMTPEFLCYLLIYDKTIQLAEDNCHAFVLFLRKHNAAIAKHKELLNSLIK